MSDLKRTNKGSETKLKQRDCSTLEIVGAIVGRETSKIKLTSKTRGDNV